MNSRQGDMDFVAALETYFKAEERLGRFLVPFCAVLGVSSAVSMLSADSSFAYGSGVPAVMFGVAGVIGASRFLARTARQLTELPALYRESPAELARFELPRMNKLNLAWPRLKRLYLVLIALSVLTIVFAPIGWVRGLASTLIFLSAMLYVVDMLAEKRALAYTARILELRDQHPT